jgi:acyl-CoA synthetase (NDP forming)
LIRRKSPGSHIKGFLVQEMAKPAEEIIIGGRRDEQFGPVVLVGTGGIFVEILRDFSLRVAPISMDEALEMLEELRVYPVLVGARGQEPLDVESLAETICRISQLLCEIPQIGELDLNPLRVYGKGKGVLILDSRVILSPERRPSLS